MKIKILSLLVISTLLSWSVLLYAPLASASLFSGSRDAVCDGAQLQSDSSGSNSSTSGSTLPPGVGSATTNGANGAETLPPGVGTTATGGVATGNANNGATGVITDGVGVGSTGACSSQAASTVNKLIKTALNILSFIIAVAAVIMIMVGGFKFVTSQGESSNIASARNTIIYAIIGLVVAALAQIIVRFVLTKST